MSSRIGTIFEDRVADILKGYFDVEISYLGKGKEIGKRREIDIVAHKKLGPLGSFIFLIECKAKKASKGDVEEFNNKIGTLRVAGDQYAHGVPVVIAEDGFSSGAEDLAKHYGIIAISFEDLFKVPIPNPPAVDIYLGKLNALAEALIERKEDIVSKDDYFAVKGVKSNYKLKGLDKPADLYIQLKKSAFLGKKQTVAVVFYIGEVNAETMNLFLEKVNKIATSQNLIVYVGFIVKSVVKEEVTEFNKKVKGSLPVCLIVADKIRLYGNKEAKPFFDLKSYIMPED